MRQPTEELIEQYHTMKKEFDSSEHIRAWLIRVVINKAKNISKSPWSPIYFPNEDCYVFHQLKMCPNREYMVFMGLYHFIAFKILS